MNGTVETPNIALENQAIKRQKLEGGKSRQVSVVVLNQYASMLKKISSEIFCLWYLLRSLMSNLKICPIKQVLD